MQYILSKNQLELSKVNAKNIKKNAYNEAYIIWKFGSKIAEKLFLYGQDSVNYAQKILFFSLHHSEQDILELIKQDFKKHNIDYNQDDIIHLIKAEEKNLNIEYSNIECFYT